MKSLSTAVLLLAMGLNLSSCANLVLKEDDTVGAKIGKASVRTLFGLVTLGTSELKMSDYRHAYQYTQRLKKAIADRTTSDTFLANAGPPAQKQQMASGDGEVWVYMEDWGTSASAYGGVAYAQGHGRKTILTFNKEGILIDFKWNSW